MKKFIVSLIVRGISTENDVTVTVFDTEQKARDYYNQQLEDLINQEIADNDSSFAAKKLLRKEIEEDSNFANDCILSAKDPYDNWWLYLQEVDFYDKTEKTILEDKLQCVANGFIDSKIDFDGVRETILSLINDYSFTKEELLKLHFDENDIDFVLDLKKEEEEK